MQKKEKKIIGDEIIDIPPEELVSIPDREPAFKPGTIIEISLSEGHIIGIRIEGEVPPQRRYRVTSLDTGKTAIMSENSLLDFQKRSGGDKRAEVGSGESGQRKAVVKLSDGRLDSEWTVVGKTFIIPVNLKTGERAERDTPMEEVVICHKLIVDEKTGERELKIEPIPLAIFNALNPGYFGEGTEPSELSKLLLDELA